MPAVQDGRRTLGAGKRNLLFRLGIFLGCFLAVFFSFAALTGGIPAWLSGTELVREIAAAMTFLFSRAVTALSCVFCAGLLLVLFSRRSGTWAVLGGLGAAGRVLRLGKGRWCRVRGEVYRSDDMTLKKVGVAVSPEVLFRHMHVIGGSGSGKTVSILQNLAVQHILMGGGLLVIDGKTDYDTIRLLYWAALKAGRAGEFHLFDLATPEVSQTYNPLIHGEPHELAEKILTTFDFSDVFYEQRQREVIHSTIKAIFEVKKLMGKPFNFRDVLWVLYYMPHSIRYLLELLRDVSGPETKEARDQLRLLDQEPDRLLFEQTAGVRSQMYRYAYAIPDPVRVNSYVPDIDLEGIIRRGEIAYFSLSSMTYQETAYCLARLVLQDVQSIAGKLQYEPRRSGLPFLIFMDEAGEYLYREFETFLKQSRSSGFGCIIMHQAVGDLVRRRGVDFRSQVESNTDTKVILRVSDPETREHMSRSFGTVISRRKVRGKSYGHLLEGIEGVLARSQEREIEEEEPLLRPETIASLRTGEGILFYGEQMFRVKFGRPKELLEEARRLKLPHVQRRWTEELGAGLMMDRRLKQYLSANFPNLGRPFLDELPAAGSRASEAKDEVPSRSGPKIHSRVQRTDVFTA